MTDESDPGAGKRARGPARRYPHGAHDAFTETEFVGLGSSTTQGYDPDDPIGNVMRQNMRHFGFDGLAPARQGPTPPPDEFTLPPAFADVLASIAGQTPPPWLSRRFSMGAALIENAWTAEQHQLTRTSMKNRLTEIEQAALRLREMIDLNETGARAALLFLDRYVTHEDLAALNHLLARMARGACAAHSDIPTKRGQGRAETIPPVIKAETVCTLVIVETKLLIHSSFPDRTPTSFVKIAINLWLAITGEDTTPAAGLAIPGDLDEGRRNNSRWLDHFKMARKFAKGPNFVKSFLAH